MKRAIIKWWISRAIDQSHDISGWLRSQIDRDPALLRFERAARQWEHGLREDSSAWIESKSLPMNVESVRCTRQVDLSARRTTLRGFAVSLATLAAVVLIGAFFSGKGRIDDNPQPSSPAGAMGLANASALRTSPADTKAVVEVIDASHALVKPFVTTFPQRFRKSILTHVDIRATYQGLAVPKAEHVWEDVKSTIHTERQQTTTDLRSALMFFSRTLPRSAARVLGLVQSAG